MRNRIFTIGLTIFAFGMFVSTASAQTNQSVQPADGFLEQPKAIFMDAPPVPASLYPTLLQQVRAANLLIHEEDTLPIGSPEYKNAHRLLVSNLRMLERQLYFNPADLARFNATTHPARSTIDQTIYAPDFPTNIPSPSFGGGTVPFDTTVFSSSGITHTYVGNAPSRRSIVVAVEERNALNVR